MLTDKLISVVVACYRDAGSIHALYERLAAVLQSVTPNHEIIYVNDASPDESQQILEELAAKDARLTVITHSRNFGSQAAFTSGMEQAIGDAVICMDGDLQDPPESIPPLVEKWLKGYDVVYGVRAKREEGLFRRICYKLFYRMWKKTAYVDVPVDAGDFALISRRVAEQLVNMPERDRFLRGMRAWLGFSQTGVEYVRQPRYAGRTTNTILDNVRWARRALFSFSYAPLEWISTLAFVCTCLSVVAVFLYLVFYFALPEAPRGFMTLLLAVLWLGSIQLLCLSVLGEYVGRIFEEVKGRPRFVVRSVINDHRAGRAQEPASNS